MRLSVKIFKLTMGLLSCACLLACSSNSDSRPEPKYEYYHPVSRKFAPEPVYSRVTWSHLPEPLPSRSIEKAPYFQPVINFLLPNSNLAEAVEALSQTIGYRWMSPKGLYGRKVSIEMEGTIEEVLGEIAKQASVDAKLDHSKRLVRIIDRQVLPKLPER